MAVTDTGRPPGAPAQAAALVLRRPRLDSLYRSLLDGHDVLVAVAAAGSGKSAQATLYAEGQPAPHIRVTLGAGDRSPERLAASLRSALAPHQQAGRAPTDDPVADTAAALRVAAGLGLGLRRDRPLVVVDRCELVAGAPAATSVLECLLDHLPDGARAILSSRSELPLLSGALSLSGRVARVTGADLALTEEEARSLLHRLGDGDDRSTAAKQRWASACGWVAGVLFGAAGGGGGLTPRLSAYLRRQVLDDLAGPERRFVLDTSVLDPVTLHGASSLCGPQAWASWRALAARPVPATATGRTLRYHPCFREFLLQELRSEDPERMERLQGLRLAPAAVPAGPRAGGTPPVAGEPRSGRRLPGRVVVVVDPFGPVPDIVVNGRRQGVRRLKLLELACLLAASRAGLSRSRAQATLFPDVDQARGGNHFRQILHQLHKLTGLTVWRGPAGEVAWPEHLEVDTCDQRFERELARARAASGEERLALTTRALANVTGPYLPASSLEWSDNRRFHLELLQEEAECEAARLCLDLGHFPLARCLSESTLSRNPYSDTAYRVIIEVELAVGTESGALGAYRRAVAARRAIGLGPPLAAAALLDAQLR